MVTGTAEVALIPIVVSTAIALAVSALVALLLVVTRARHLRWTGDSHLHLPQKIHRDEVPRVGGLAIVAGFVAGVVHNVWFGAIPPAIAADTALLLLAALAPVALVGFGEDITKRVTPHHRLLWIGIGSLLVVVLGKLWLGRIDIPVLDPLFGHWAIAVTFSVFACVGAANAYNIVDGLNGLLAGVALITLASIAWVAATVGDHQVFALSTLLAVATIGWLPFNWPHARLFAGDGGAYALGFLTAALLLLLVSRNPQVSPWFGMVAAALPVWETLYSIWRRMRLGLSSMEPDQSHLHQLIRTRVHWTLKHRALRRAGVWSMDWEPPATPQPPLRVEAPNAACSPLLWSLHAGAAGFAATCWHSTPLLAATMVAFALLYVLIHRWLVRQRIKYRLSLQG